MARHRPQPRTLGQLSPALAALPARVQIGIVVLGPHQHLPKNYWIENTYGPVKDIKFDDAAMKCGGMGHHRFTATPETRHQEKVFNLPQYFVDRSGRSHLARPAAFSDRASVGCLRFDCHDTFEADADPMAGADGTFPLSRAHPMGAFNELMRRMDHKVVHKTQPLCVKLIRSVYGTRTIYVRMLGTVDETDLAHYREKAAFIAHDVSYVANAFKAKEDETDLLGEAIVADLVGDIIARIAEAEAKAITLLVANVVQTAITHIIVKTWGLETLM
jgi:hypothetical protein